LSVSCAFSCAASRFGAVPPLSQTSISLDDKYPYVACASVGELRHYDVSNPRKPELTGSVYWR
jgi:selenium-binding protein 1